MYTVQDNRVIDNNAVYRGYRVTHVCDGCLRDIHVLTLFTGLYMYVMVVYRVIHVLTLFTGLYMY
jgi:hypothetical protein